VAESNALPEPELRRLRAAIVATGRRMGTRGLVSATEGNLSVRLPGDRLLVTPTGVRKDELEPGELVVVPLATGTSSPAGGRTAASPGHRPSSDIAIHRAVQAARRDVLVVAHAHPPATLALTVAGELANPDDLPETAMLLPRLPFVPFGRPGSDELAARIAAALTEPPEPGPGAVLLERHGAVTVGGRVPATEAEWAGAAIEALGQAVDRLELVEVLCRTTRDALLLRAARRSVD